MGAKQTSPMRASTSANDPKRKWRELLMSEHRISAQLVNDVVNAVVGYGKPKGQVTPAGRPPLFGTGCRIRTGRQPVMEKETTLHSALTPHCDS